MRRPLIGLVAATSLALLFPVTARSADKPIVTGAGSTWSQVAVDQWRADVSRFGLRINYQGVGSSAGRSFYIQDQVDFAVSEIPFEQSELNALRSKNKQFVYLPIVAGGTSLMYNLRNASNNPITTLRLSARTVTGIFTGEIKKWNDQTIRSENPGLALPDLSIVPVVRSDGSGTSAQFSAYMSKMEHTRWCAFATKQGISCTYTSNYPNFSGSVAQSGSDGVANYVHSESTGRGAITYVEAAYALQRGRPVSFLRNASNRYTLPTSKNVSVALTKATLNADRTQNLDQVYVNPDANAYAMSSYSYMVAPTNNISTAKGDVLGRFMVYFACDGQRKADLLGYSPLPPNLVSVVFDAVKRVPGAPTPPALEKCNNPTITGGQGATSNRTAGALSGGTSATGSVPATGSVGGSGAGSAGTGAGGALAAGGSAAGGAAGTDASGAPLDPAGGAYANGQTGELQALPRIRAGTRLPSGFPLAMAALIVAILTFGPPVLGNFLDRRLRRAR